MYIALMGLWTVVCILVSVIIRALMHCVMSFEPKIPSELVGHEGGKSIFHYR